MNIFKKQSLRIINLQMVQDILVFTTITGAVIYMIWGIYKSVAPVKESGSNFCGGCSPSGCDSKSLKKN